MNYKIRFHHGVGGSLEKFEPIYSYLKINEDENIRLKEAMELQLFLVKIERAYEHIIDNYHDFEENNFSIILKNELYRKKPPRTFRKQYGSFVKHLLNFLTSTYLYTSVLKIKRKDVELKDDKGNLDFSFENSSDIRKIYDLKLRFKSLTNNFHKTRYQYTFMSALRNQLNHGGTLPEGYTSGGYWSLYWDKEKTKETGIVIKGTDQRFSRLDYKISKEYTKQVFDNKKHFKYIENDMPDEFYLRQAIRVYVDLVSEAHAKVRLESEQIIQNSYDLIKGYLSKSDGFSAVIQRHENKTLKEEMGLFLSEKTIDEMQNDNEAPLHIEYYAGMPGEHRDLPTLNKPIQKR